MSLPYSSHIPYDGIMSLLNHIRMSSFLSLFVPTTVPLARCIMRCIVNAIFVGALHRVLTIFHSKVLHQILNLFVVLTLALKTATGRTAVGLISEIFGFNFICCCVALYYRHTKLDLNMDNKTEEFMMKMYKRTIVNASEKRKVLKTSTWLGSIILAISRRSKM